MVLNEYLERMTQILPLRLKRKRCNVPDPFGAYSLHVGLHPIRPAIIPSQTQKTTKGVTLINKYRTD
jgi:hypothetical protein